MCQYVGDQSGSALIGSHAYRKIADTHSGFTLASTVAYKIRIKRYKISIRNVVSVENDENHEKEIAHIDYSVTQSCHQIRLLKYEIV